MWRELYRAESLDDAVPLILKHVPVWAPMTALLGGTLLYAGSVRLRLLLSKWRRRERARLVQKHQLDSAASSPSPRRVDDSMQLENVDATVVTEDDLYEFHLSLGLMSPRDDDLIELVNKMILSDPIPDGWILFRCSGGFLRFRELNTDELRFFHPDARTTETVVRNTLSARNAADIEFQFGCVSRGASTSYSGGGNEPDVDFDAAIQASKKDEETFGRLLAFFMKRETAKIEAEVEESFRPSRGKTTSTCRRGGLTPSLRVTINVPHLDMKRLETNHKQNEERDRVGEMDPADLSRTLSGGSLPPMPKRPPTPRSSGVFEQTTSGVHGQPPRVPSFRGPRSGASTPSNNHRASLSRGDEH